MGDTEGFDGWRASHHATVRADRALRVRSSSMSECTGTLAEASDPELLDTPEPQRPSEIARFCESRDTREPASEVAHRRLKCVEGGAITRRSGANDHINWRQRRQKFAPHEFAKSSFDAIARYGRAIESRDNNRDSGMPENCGQMPNFEPWSSLAFSFAVDPRDVGASGQPTLAGKPLPARRWRTSTEV